MRFLLAAALAAALACCGCSRTSDVVMMVDLAPIAADATELLKSKFPPAHTQISIPAAFDEFGEQFSCRLREAGYGVSDEAGTAPVMLRYLLAPTQDLTVYLKMEIDGRVVYSRMYDENGQPLGCWARRDKGE